MYCRLKLEPLSLNSSKSFASLIYSLTKNEKHPQYRKGYHSSIVPKQKLTALRKSRDKSGFDPDWFDLHLAQEMEAVHHERK
jgi:hypothetical protein